jgi:hypothetical protein
MPENGTYGSIGGRWGCRNLWRDGTRTRWGNPAGLSPSRPTATQNQRPTSPINHGRSSPRIRVEPPLRGYWQAHAAIARIIEVSATS